MNFRNKIKKIFVSGREVWPIVEGGKGIGVSDGRSSGAFAESSAVGTFSGANAKLIDDNGQYIPLEYKGRTRLERHNELIDYSIKAAISQARIAYNTSKGEGRIHMNVLWEMAAAQRVLHEVLEGARSLIHGVTCGAGMPYDLAKIASQYQVYYYPIVSSARAFKALWQRSYRKISQWLGGVVYEDPWLAGGHNGLSNSEKYDAPQLPFDRVADIRSFMNEVGLNNIPIIMAGGVWCLRDWEDWLDNPSLLPIAFQFGTRPLLTVESAISDEWKKKLLLIRKGDVFLNRFSPTGFYSSAVKNHFLQRLERRSKRQLSFRTNQDQEFSEQLTIGQRSSKVFLRLEDKILAENWIALGYKEIMKTPDSTLIFVEKEEFNKIREDQISCMGCLSHCLFSNWKDHDNYNTERKPDPRSFCIQKTLQRIIHGASPDEELMFAGHKAYMFSEDPLYRDGNIPTVKELIEQILQGN